MPLSLLLLRAVFLTVAAAIGASLAITFSRELNPLWMFSAVMALALAVLAADVGIKAKSLTVISSIYFGAIVGLFLSYVSNLALQVLPLEAKARDPVQLILSTVLVYICISLLLQTRDDFRFIIPYVEFAREVKGLKPFVLDASVLIDGRFADVVEAKIIDNKLVVPQFVLAELQAIAAGGDRARRQRGRMGLDVVQRLQQMEGADFELFDRDLPEFEGQTDDLKLVILARHLDGKIVTNDGNLEKVAKVRGVVCVNLNAVTLALRHQFVPGDHFEVRITKPGEDPRQGVGYLPDGTMVVVENARNFINRRLACEVTKTIQTNNGPMIFARLEREIAEEAAS